MAAAAPKHSAMRCSTPMMRSVSQLAGTSSPAASQRTKGAALSSRPMAKISSVRLRHPAARTARPGPQPAARHHQASALPTANRKNGNTRSVGVQPCQGACASGGYSARPGAGVVDQDHQRHGGAAKHVQRAKGAPPSPGHPRLPQCRRSAPCTLPSAAASRRSGLGRIDTGLEHHDGHLHALAAGRQRGACARLRRPRWRAPSGAAHAAPAWRWWRAGPPSGCRRPCSAAPSRWS
jgi:hypothetical protein